MAQYNTTELLGFGEVLGKKLDVATGLTFLGIFSGVVVTCTGLLERRLGDQSFSLALRI